MSNNFKVNPYGQFFTDAEGKISVEVAWLEDKNEHGLHDALIRISGKAAHDEGIDNKTYLYKASPAGTGVNFTYMYNGKETVRMITRSSWGSWEFFECFVSSDTFKIYPDTYRSKEVRPLHLLTDYKEVAKSA